MLIQTRRTVVVVTKAFFVGNVKRQNKVRRGVIGRDGSA